MGVYGFYGYTKGLLIGNAVVFVADDAFAV